jgi:hypothetical protein
VQQSGKTWLHKTWLQLAFTLSSCGELTGWHTLQQPAYATRRSSVRAHFSWKDKKVVSEKKSLFKQTLGVGLLLVLSGCQVARNAQSDLSRLVNSDPFATPKPAVSAPRTASAAAKPATTEPAVAAATPAKSAPTTTVAPVDLIGKSEGEVRALLGPPTSVEERAPGKTWHYREGQCTVDIQLYPDVQTRQFGTLAYEVKSDDNTDEGKRGCLAQLQSRSPAKGGG